MNDRELLEPVEVVGYLNGSNLLTADAGRMFAAKCHNGFEPLMTVAQHKRIMVVRGAEELHDSLRMFGIDINFDTKTKGTEIQQEIVEAVFNAMLAAAPAQPQSDDVIVPRAIAERMAIDAAQYEHEHAVVNDNVQLWQQPSARLTLTVGDLRTVRALLGGEA